MQVFWSKAHVQDMAEAHAMNYALCTGTTNIKLNLTLSLLSP